MAEAVLSQISGDFLECTICLEPYKDPKILPCLHTFCKDCLDKFVAKQGEAKDRFPCPTCRIETVLPEGGVAGLKNNFFVLSLRDTVDAHKSLVSKEDNKVSCDVCEEEVATCGCVVCEEFLCDECTRAHSRFKRNRDHEIIGVAELKEQKITKMSSVKSTSLPMCPKHEDEKLKFYCETCQSPICRDCTVVQHKDHKYGYLTDVESDVRAKIREKLEAARPKIQEYRDAAGLVDEKQAELDTKSKKTADDIDAAAEEEIKYYTGLVRRKQTELKEKLAAVTAARSKQLSATADSVESTLGCLSSTVDFSQKVVEHGSDFDVMNVYSDVTARLESLLKGPTPDIPDDISYVRFEPRKEKEEREMILGDIVDSYFRTAKLTTLGASGRLGPTTLGTHYRGQDHEHLVTLHDGIQHFTVPGTGTYSIEAADSYFRTAKLTTLGASGRLGPTTLGTHYRGQDHEHLVTLHDGIQHFTVPRTGTYSIEAAGWGVGNPKSARGRGAVLRRTFNLKQGETLKILVGQEGAENKRSWDVGGGGGTFVTRGDNTPLIIAGGGGGAGYGLQTHNPLCDGTVSTTGNKSCGGTGCSGGSNGQGATEWKGEWMGGGGGGLLTDGGSSKQFGGNSCQHGGEGGKAFANGGVGGRGACNNADGGFGGGGGGRGSGGGGEVQSSPVTPAHLKRAGVMAEAVLRQISGDFLECTICLEPYKDPKILPCLHTFCKDCLEKFVAKQGEAKDRFPCPTCRIETVLPEGGVAGLKNNFFVLSLRDTVDAHKSLVSKEDDKVPCNCEEHVANFGCVVCEEFLCDECARVHRRAKRTRDHEVIGVAELKEQLITKTSSGRSTSLPMCPKHEDEKLKFYCETCQSPICRDCTVLQHKDHKYGLLADVVSDVRAKIKGNLEAARSTIEEFRDAASVAANKQAELDTRSKKAADDIDAAAEEEIKYYTCLVRRKQTELKEKLAAVTAARSKQLSATADSVESTLGCLSSTVDFSQKVVEHGSDFDVMNVYSDVTARLESLLKGPTPDIPDDISYVRFDPKTKRKKKEIILGDIVDHLPCYKLTTLGASGRLGPTTLGTHYRGQDHEHLVTLHDGIQHFTVPGTGTYSIEAAGAAAGWGQHNPTSARGRGAVLRGTFNLKQGETLKILVGQEGAENRGNWSVGGGGGTFVTRGDNTPLIIAGGGGGAGWGLQTHNPLCDGTVSTTGNKACGGTGCSGGSNGQGATEWKDNGMVMAEAVLSQISGDFLECTICLEPYKDPKILPCLHTFCKDCLKKFVAKQGEGKDRFPCPTCRIETVLPEGGVAGLKNNFFVLSLRDTVDAHKSLVSKEDDEELCDVCEEVANGGCVVCEEFLCDECARVHRRAKRTRGHEVIGVAELKEQLITKTPSVKSISLPMCPKHEDEKLKFYCETCQSPICRDCTVLQHKDHKYGYLTDVVSDVRVKIKGKLEVARPKIKEYRGAAEVVAEKQEELDTRSKKAADDIDAAAEEEIKYYTGLVRRKQTELKEKLAAVTAARSKQLSAAADSVESTLGCLSSTVDFSQKVVEHGSDFDVMNVYCDVTARLESLLKGPTPDIPDDISYVRFEPKTERQKKKIILGDIVDSSFRSAKLTTLGASGRLGPTTLGTHYRGQDHEHLVTLHDGIQHFTVPGTGTYSVEAAGAAAGWGRYNPKSVRGRGAVLRGTFNLKQGETLKILVGQEGAENKRNWSVGGGGGTFVTRGDNTPLIIAGGGGGAGYGLSTHNPLCDGTVSTTGNKSSGETGCSGGSNGQGATGWEGGCMGGGGGGLLTDGGSSKRFGGDSCLEGGEGGKAFVNGGVGGSGVRYNADGGFGGGGGGYGNGGGGGGGYSGGGRGRIITKVVEEVAVRLTPVLTRAVRVGQISGDFLECTICLEPYKDPKILPCLHTFCKDCLEKFVAKQSKVKDRFPCPTCRIETVLPEGSVAGLKNNFFVLSLGDTVDAHKSLVSKEDDKVSCDVCEEEVATCGCAVCEEFLCDECARAHRRAKRTRDHEVIGVAKLKEQLITKTSSVKSTSLPMCPKHEDEKLKFYCETCQSPICRDCTVLQHKDHKYGLLADVVSDVRAKIKGKLEATMPKIEEYRDVAGLVAEKQAELDTRSKKAADDIDAAAEEEIKYYTGLVRRKQTELKEKLAVFTAARSKQLSATADSVESTLGCLSSTVDFSQKVVQHGSDFDVMNVYCDVTARLESLLKGPTPDIPDDISYVRFEPRKEREEREMILGDIVDSSFRTAKLTTLGASGRLGPTTLGTHYRGQDHEHLVTLHDGIQHFTVPRTGTYSIEAAGAAAGWGRSNPKSVRGRGAVLRGTFNLKQDETLNVLVGQEGAGNTARWGVGGGGGTFVTRGDNTPLIIAGGGGGAGWGLQTHNPLCDGTVSTTGNKAYGGSGCSGGSNGQGATEWKGNFMGGGGEGVMAEAVLSQISGDFLECTICLEPYKDPKILPCLHTFCKGCLEKFVAKQGEAKDRFPCPTCRIETVLPEGGVAGLKNNFFVLSLRDTVQAHKSVASVEEDKVSCDVCEEEVATCGCAVCEKFLCEECTRAHRRAKRTRDHEAVGVAELKEWLITKTSSTKSGSLPMCPKHEDEKLKFYCETCQSPICRDCTVLQHKDHKYGYLADVVSDVRAKIKGKLEATRPKIEEYRDAAGVVAEKQAELDTRSKKAADDIDAAAEEEIKSYTGLVRRKQTELKEKLAAVTAARSKQLSATADSVESTLGCLSSTVDFSQKVVEHGSDFDVMNVYSDVTARLESLLKGPTPDIHDDISYVRFEPRKERAEREMKLGDIVDFNFRSAKLTTLGASGRLGPTTLGTHYRGQDHEHLVTLHDGIQHFTVPRTGTYSIETAGAAAGWGLYNPKSARGRGAVLRGTFNLKQGENLKILVGQEGAENTVDWSVGGGGGTFVTRGDNTPLIIAGGGGGAGYNLQTHNRLCDGTVSTTGNKSYGGTGCSGGSNGQGAIEWKGNHMGGGGGGLLTDGGSSKQFGGDSCVLGGEGGKAFVNGGVGGRGEYSNAGGGFGGGGGSYGAGGGGGGGGGYSGGCRGESRIPNGGGGGGSFNSGTDTSGQDGANDGPGYVVITRQV
ncbi:PREDICTED: LOW QUALITY PROTEIN: uncharacterized protein LOC109488024 [Branchiostoma belcheri]|uniref:LOW QUALITY PROTEIN: uncharacterized protein LOC109488024 n=1 Tax=Branchiostoma belcheri TaxID=7741 RepID=A0A6P5ADB6_BRABE|nr:PREDICTED: LOW QUALITY PROTEIN: uncharacterized protein LOC109488024 [Branchiostoma belcheri]